MNLTTADEKETIASSSTYWKKNQYYLQPVRTALCRLTL
jgi:hypothetical protein